jgi:3-deoxy-D-manno-octulosonate 8-phosphate phosphatase (KDO 8-P phosphatase)
MRARTGVRPMTKRIAARAKRVRLAIFDVDGVLTDGTVRLSARGEEVKAFNILDGLGLKMLAGSGVQLALLSGRKSPVVALRARELGIRHVLQGIGDKLAAYEKLLAKLRLSPSETAVMGDELPDLPVLQRCGLALSVPNAPRFVRERVHHVTETAGGRGAVREACELLMAAQGTLGPQLEAYLE